MSSTEELVKLAQRGDTAAFTGLVRRYQRASILSAYAVLGDFHTSQDAAQEAFVIGFPLEAGQSTSPEVSTPCRQKSSFMLLRIWCAHGKRLTNN